MRRGGVHVVIEVREHVLRRQGRDPVGPDTELGAPVPGLRSRPLMEAEVGPSAGDDRIDPLGKIFTIGQAQTPVEEWAAFCAKEGLSGPLAT